MMQIFQPYLLINLLQLFLKTVWKCLKWRGDFYIETPSDSGGFYPNVNFIKGSAVGGGWSDAGAHANVEYYSYDMPDEWVM